MLLFPSQPNLLFLLFICLLFFLFIFFFFYSLITVPTQRGPCLCGPPCPKRSRETRPCGFADNDMNGHGGRATSLRTKGRRWWWRRRKDDGNEKGWERCTQGAPVQPLFLFLYSLWLGRNSQFPGWFYKDRWNEERGGEVI